MDHVKMAVCGREDDYTLVEEGPLKKVLTSLVSKEILIINLQNE
jgi:hypothetical protein